MINNSDRARLEKEQAIAQINARLELGAVPVRVYLKGKNALVLQATLPKKSGQGEGRKQYCLSLGIAANSDGLKRIEAEAQRLGSLMTLGRFSWSLYMDEVEPEVGKEPRAIAEWIEAFKIHHAQRYKIQERTWHDSWQVTLGKLPQQCELNEAAILAVIEQTEPHTRIRELTVQRLQALIRFMDFPLDLKPYQGDYNQQSLQPRELPSDELIMEWRDKIPNKGWRDVFGLIATFGIRPHEAFFCRFVDEYKLEVMNGKTCRRIARAIHPDWVQEWSLQSFVLPNVKGRVFRDYGQRCSLQFRRYKVPFVPYDLRHAWAIRATVVKRLPYSVSAKAMGHSIQVHTNTYHRWISEMVGDKVYDDLVLGLE
jgi:integrase